MGKPPRDFHDSESWQQLRERPAITALAWALAAADSWGCSSEQRRKDVLRLQFAALERDPPPAVKREIRALNPLARTPPAESAALRAFRRTLGGPAFRQKFERWYAQEVDRAPLRGYVAELPGDESLPAQLREIRLPTNGRPRRLVTLARDQQRTLVQAAFAAMQAAVRAWGQRWAADALWEELATIVSELGHRPVAGAQLAEYARSPRNRSGRESA